MTEQHASIPFWLTKKTLPSFPKLEENLKTDVIIIGAGIAGLTAGYLLSQSGKKIVILDDGPVAGGETSRTTAHLTNALDDRYYNLERYFGVEGTKLAAASHAAAIDFMEKLTRDLTIDCHFERVDAYIFNPPGQSSENLIKEFEAVQRAGIKEVELVEKAPLNFDTGPALKFPHQAEFEPLAYIEELCRQIIKNQGKIFNYAHASKIKADGHCVVETDNGFNIQASDVIVATNSPINNPLFPHLKQASYRTYVIAGYIPKDSEFSALYYDTLDPYHYIRIVKDQPEYDILIVGGEDHRVGEYKDPNAIYEILEKWTITRFPKFKKFTHWSGQIVEPVDSLAFIGRTKEDSHIYIATGDSGNGLTHGTIAGILLNDLIYGRSNPWEGLYNPLRKTWSAAYDFCAENLNTFYQYADWIKPGEIKDVNELKPGTGAILNEGLKKIAAYCDKKGKIHKYSAVCPHLEGVVHWNPAENSWDCPCHGSRFTCDGKVLNGPANENLKEFKDTL